jgi:nucleoside-triphosphatase
VTRRWLWEPAAYSVAVTKILLEGRPGIGKTTIAARCVELLNAAGVPVQGFTTREWRVKGRRVGFYVDVIDGDSAVLAHVDLPGSPRVGRYGVDVTAFEQLVLPALRADREAVWVIDELGKMELASRHFQERIIELVDTADSLLATVHRHRHPLTDQLKARSDVSLVEVTLHNRDQLPSQLVAALTRPG